MLVFIRKKSKQVWVFVSVESKQSLGLGIKLVQVLQDFSTHAFLTRFYDL